MFRVAFVVAVVAIAAMANASGPVSPSDTPVVSPPSCHPGQPLDLDCAVHALDANGDGSISAAELANFALPAPAAFDWAPLPPPPERTGLDFKDAATDPAPVAPIALDHSGPPPVLSALLALGALVVLLRRRPT